MTIGTIALSPLHLALAAAGFGAILLFLWVALRKPASPPLSHRSPESQPRPALREAAETSPETLHGGLRHMPLPDLLQFLAQGRRTGTLDISSGRRAGQIHMVEGLIVHADYRRTHDLDALFGLLALETGDFVFTPGTPPEYAVSGREVVDILMLWLSRKDSPR